MIPETRFPQLPSATVLTALRTKIADARVTERTRREKAASPKVPKPVEPSPAEIKKQRKETLLAELKEFLLITDRSDDEIKTKTKKFEKVYAYNGFASDGTLERHLEEIYGQTDGKELKTMILKMLLVLGNGYANLLAVRLDPKHADHEFGKQFFLGLDKNQMRDYIANIWYPNKEDIEIMLQYSDRDFIKNTISSLGTQKKDRFYCRELLFLLVEKLAPDFDFSTVAKLFEVGVDHNGDHLRQRAAELMKTKYPVQARDYFKQVAENKELNKDGANLGLRIAGIRHYALAKGETANADLKSILLAEQSIDLADAILPLLSDAAICGTNGRELIAEIIDERHKKEEPPLELYWLAMDGYVYSPKDGQLKEVDGYHDLLKTVFSKVSNGEKLLANLIAMGVKTGRVLRVEELLKSLAGRTLLPATCREGVPIDRLINRIGIERLEDWALQSEEPLLSRNAYSILAHCTGEQLDKAKRLTEAIGMVA